MIHNAIALIDHKDFIKAIPNRVKIIWIGGDRNTKRIVSLPKENSRLLADKVIAIMTAKNKHCLFPMGDFANEVAEKMDELMAFRRRFEEKEKPLLEKNLKLNLPFMGKFGGIESLKNKHLGKDILLVGAGPSFTENVSDIIKYRDKFVIVACGSGIRSLSLANITPDYFLYIDPFVKAAEKVIGFYTDQTTCLFACTASPFAVQCSNNMKFFVTEFEAQQFGIESKHIFPVDIAATSSALFMGLFLGGKRIVMVGQDLSFKLNSKTHEWGDDPDRHALKHYSVKTVDGSEGWVDMAFKELIDWMSFIIPQFPLPVYNITKSGAVIDGCVLTTMGELYD